VPVVVELAIPVKPSVKKPVIKVAPIANVPEVSFGNIKKPEESETQFDRDLSNFEKRIPQ
jgi:hypothetical protein